MSKISTYLTFSCEWYVFKSLWCNLSTVAKRLGDGLNIRLNPCCPILLLYCISLLCVILNKLLFKPTVAKTWVHLTTRLSRKQLTSSVGITSARTRVTIACQTKPRRPYRINWTPILASQRGQVFRHYYTHLEVCDHYNSQLDTNNKVQLRLFFNDNGIKYSIIKSGQNIIYARVTSKKLVHVFQLIRKSVLIWC